MLATCMQLHARGRCTHARTHVHPPTSSRTRLRTVISLVSYWCSVLLASSRLARSSLSLIATCTSSSLRCSASHSAWRSVVGRGAGPRRVMEGAWGAGGMGGGVCGSWVGWLRAACLRVQRRLHLSLRALRRLKLPRGLDAARLHLAHVLLLVRDGLLQGRQLVLEPLRVGHDVRAQLLELLLGVEHRVLGLRQPVLDLRRAGGQREAWRERGTGRAARQGGCAAGHGEGGRAAWREEGAW